MQETKTNKTKEHTQRKTLLRSQNKNKFEVLNTIQEDQGHQSTREEADKKQKISTENNMETEAQNNIMQ